VHNMAASASSTASASSSAGGDLLRSLDAGETCSYYAPASSSSCRYPRTCQSCLEIEGCMIDAVGVCVSLQQERYNESTDYTRAIEQGLALPNATADTIAIVMAQSWQFLAGTVEYCPRSDTTCQQCIRQNFWRGRNTYPDSRFCVGANGCVCVDVCERRWYVESDCPTTPSWTPSTTSESTYYSGSVGERMWRGMIVFVAFAVLFLLMMVRRRKAAEAREHAELEQHNSRQQARRQRRHDRAEALGVNPLSLTGWVSYRRDLIDKEKTQLAGGGDVHNAARESDDESSGEGTTGDGVSSQTHHDGSTTEYVRMQDDDTPAAPRVLSPPSSSRRTTPADLLPNLQLAPSRQRSSV
jgi:hypothetical protein